MKRRMQSICGTMLVFVMVVMIAPNAFGASKNFPSVIGITTYGSGSKGYAIATGIAHAIQKGTGLKTRVVPAASKARAISVARKEVTLGVHYEIAMYEIQGGIWNLQKEGPQDLALAWVGYLGSTTLMWRGDSGIKTPADIKGKRVTDYRVYSKGQFMNMLGKLAFFGIGENDVKWVPGATYAKGMQMVVDGTADVCYATGAASKVYELASSVHGAVLTEFPASNKAGWSRTKKICPVVGPGKVEVGFGASKENPKEWITFPGYYFSRFDADEELIYTLIKAVYEGYDIYKGAHPEAPRWDIVSALNMDRLNTTGLPYHSGAIKLFKEIGRWTDRHEKWQQSRIEFRQKLLKTYKETLDDAKAKKVDVKDPEFEKLWFPKWKEMRAELAALDF